jgi:hypothetical protein
MSSIQDEAEAVRWLGQGRTYEWMCQEHERRYGVTVAPSAFADLRRSRGIDRVVVSDGELVPWDVDPEHRWCFDLAMLRAEARRRAGARLRPQDDDLVARWCRRLHDAGLVVHYDPQTEEGFWYVPRRPGVDLDLVREP